MRTRGFLAYYGSMFLSPASTFRALAEDPRAMRFGFLAMLVPALGYTLFYVLASRAGGAPTVFEPWLNVPKAEYFSYGVYLALPGYLLAYFFACGAVTFTASLLDLRMPFATTATIIGFGVGVGSWTGMAHDLTDAVLGFLGVIDMAWYERQLNLPTVWMALLWTVYTLYFAWIFLLFTTGARSIAGLSRPRAALVALLCLVSFQGVLLLFIR